MKLISLGSTGFICDSPSLSSGLFCERSRSVWQFIWARGIIRGSRS
jgi:hypothetical protein